MRTRSIRQSITFKASPHEVYELLMDSGKHSKFTGDKATISRKVGGKFTVGDYIQGGNLDLVPDQRIVQSWRFSDWPKGHFSQAVFSLEAIDGGTRLTFSQSEVPEDNYKDIKQGWHDYYWTPMKNALDPSKKKRRAGL
jgi:activator of HSP90 ATPase